MTGHWCRVAAESGTVVPLCKYFPCFTLLDAIFKLERSRKLWVCKEVDFLETNRKCMNTGTRYLIFRVRQGLDLVLVHWYLGWILAWVLEKRGCRNECLALVIWKRRANITQYTLGTRGFFSRATGSFVLLAAGRHVFDRRPKTRAAKSETAHEKPMASRVHLIQHFT